MIDRYVAYAPDPAVTRERQHGLALAAALTSTCGWSHLHLGAGPPGAGAEARAYAALVEHDAEHPRLVAERLRWLDAEGHRTTYARLRGELLARPLDPGATGAPAIVARWLPLVGSIEAYDRALQVVLARAAAGVGFLPDDEAWRWVERARAAALASCRSWEEVGHAALAGAELATGRAEPHHRGEVFELLVKNGTWWHRAPWPAPADAPPPVLDGDISAPMRALVDRYAGALAARMRRAGVVSDAARWTIDLHAGVAHLAGDPARAFRCQVLGVVDRGAATWSWAWTEAGRHLPAAITEAARRLRAIGAQRDVPELASPRVGMSLVPAIQIAVAAAGALGAVPALVGFPGAIVVLAIDDRGAPPADELPIRQFATLLPAVVRDLAFDGRAAARAFAEALGLTWIEEAWPRVSDGARGVQLELDADGRLTGRVTG